MVEIDRRKAALIAELEISRGEIRRALRACEENLDVVSVLRRNVSSNLKFWLPGAALGGWVVSKLLTLQMSRPRKVREFVGKAHEPSLQSRSWLVALLKVVVDLLRPTLVSMGTDWLARKASEFSHAVEGQPPSPPSRTAEGERQGHARNGIF